MFVAVILLLGMLIFACISAGSASAKSQKYLSEINRLNNEKLIRDKKTKKYLDSLSAKSREKYNRIMSENIEPEFTAEEENNDTVAEEEEFAPRKESFGEKFIDSFLDAWDVVEQQEQARKAYNDRSILERQLNYSRDIIAYKNALLSNDRDTYNRIFGNKK